MPKIDEILNVFIFLIIVFLCGVCGYGITKSVHVYFVENAVKSECLK